MDEIYLPNVHTFENKNVFSGSCGLLRFMLTPHDGVITCRIWHGLYCMEKSEIEDERDFPLSAEGRAAIEQWLLENREPPKQPPAGG